MIRVCQRLKTVIVTPAVYPHFLNFFTLTFRALGTHCHDLGHDSWMSPCLKSAHNCTVNFSRRRHSTRQSHGLFALAKHLLLLSLPRWSTIGLGYGTIRKARTVAAFCRVACLFSVSRPSVVQFVLERYFPDCQRTSPVSEPCCPLCQTAYNVQITNCAVNRQIKRQRLHELCLLTLRTFNELSS